MFEALPAQVCTHCIELLLNQQMEDLAPGTDLLRRCLKPYSYITWGVQIHVHSEQVSIPTGWVSGEKHLQIHMHYDVVSYIGHGLSIEGLAL